MLIKRGKWVIADGRIGILEDVTSFPEVGVMLVDPETGENLAGVRALLGQLTTARIDQIPPQRRPSQERCNELGYF